MVEGALLKTYRPAHLGRCTQVALNFTRIIYLSYKLHYIFKSYFL